MLFWEALKKDVENVLDHYNAEVLLEKARAKALSEIAAVQDGWAYCWDSAKDVWSYYLDARKALLNQKLHAPSDWQSLCDQEPISSTVADDFLQSLDAPAPAWVSWLISHNGAPCPTGSAPPPYIEEVFSHTSYGPLHGVTPPACAATMCAALEETGFKSTHNAAASSYLTYGTPSGLIFGAIVVLRGPSGDHHVTTFDSWMPGRTGEIALLRGGNQSHKVCLEAFNVSGNAKGHNEIVATRWPVK